MATGQARSLGGRTALVTGASAGIGRATAHALARGGADVAVAARSEGKLERVADAVADDHGVETLAVPADVRDPAEVAAMVEATVDRFGGLDVLVSNAGVTSPGFDEHVEEIPTDEFRRVVETNVGGTFYATRAALPHLRASKGNLVFVGSSSAKLPRPGAPVYAGSKWFVRGFALSVEAHAGQDGVAVTLVNPTAVRTALWPDLEAGEAAEPEEVADVISFAARQAPHSTLSEVDLFRRDLLGKFVPEQIDLDLAYDLD